MADWKDILSDNEQQISEEELLKYLDVDTPEEEKHAIESKINNNPFEADALQGLLQVQNKKNLEKSVNQLNQKLHQLTGKRHHKTKREINVFEWSILTLVLLLFICIIFYIIMILNGKSEHHAQIIINNLNLFELI